MIVCLCRVVTDRAIRAARANGADSIEAVTAATGAGACCGTCRPAIARILAEPCGPAPCEGCPARPAPAGSPESVPLRVAAGGRETP